MHGQVADEETSHVQTLQILQQTRTHFHILLAEYRAGQNVGFVRYFSYNHCYSVTNVALFQWCTLVLYGLFFSFVYDRMAVMYYCTAAFFAEKIQYKIVFFSFQ